MDQGKIVSTLSRPGQGRGKEVSVTSTMGKVVDLKVLSCPPKPLKHKNKVFVFLFLFSSFLLFLYL